MHTVLASIHRWVGIAIGLWIALIAVSGIGMIFSTTFYGWEFGEADTHVEMRSQPYVSPDIWLQKAEAKFGPIPNVEGFFGPRATPMRISAPAIVYTPPGTRKHGIVTVDPYSGEPLAHFVADDSWSFLPLWLHLSLFLGEQNMMPVLTVLSVVLILFGISGLFLWWPAKGRLAASLSVPKPKSPVNLRRFHSAVGAWTSPLIFLAGLTGLMLANFPLAEALTDSLGAAAEFNPEEAVLPTCATRAGDAVGTGYSNARALYPDRELAAMSKGTPDQRFITIWLRPANSTVPARGDTEIVTDARCGKVMFHRSTAQMKTGDVILTFAVELHNGRLLGLFGEALIFLQGLALATLPVAGITLYFWRRRRKKGRLASPGHVRTA
jgi:uncharacterized iron-regulated membrane protein